MIGLSGKIHSTQFHFISLTDGPNEGHEGGLEEGLHMNDLVFFYKQYKGIFHFP
jgi:hypothetical protein